MKRPAATTTASGVSVYGYRYLDPVHGRWLNRDPIGEEGGLNLYSFVANDSVRFVDALGLATVTVNHRRTGADHFNVYGTLEYSVDSESRSELVPTKTIRECCGETKVLSIEPAFGIYNNPRGKKDREFPFPLQDASSDGAILAGDGDNGRNVTPGVVAGDLARRVAPDFRVPPPRWPRDIPNGITRDELNDAMGWSQWLGNGNVFIHGGHCSYYSAFCLIIGVKVDMRYLIQNDTRYPGTTLGAFYWVKGFSPQSSFDAIIKTTAYLKCVAKHSNGVLPDFNYRRRGGNPPRPQGQATPAARAIDENVNENRIRAIPLP